MPNRLEICSRAPFAPVFGLLLVACQPPAAGELPLADATGSSGCGAAGHLEAGLFGSLETALRWSGSNMVCENMQRPDGAGVRFRFAGDLGDERLALILALPDLARGQTGRELPTKLTLIVEGSGRFFSTPHPDSCWTDIESHAPAEPDTGAYVVSGALYCVAALGEVNGDAAISIPELSFSTIVDWDN